MLGGGGVAGGGIACLVAGVALFHYLLYQYWRAAWHLRR